jgi:regulator of sigma E protease
LDLSEEERAKTFQVKPLWQRALIVLAGPLTNLLFALAVFTGFNMIIGIPQAAAVIGSFAEKSTAQAAGLKAGDQIVAIDGARISDFFDVQQHTLMHPGKKIVMTLDRHGERLTLPVTIGDQMVDDGLGHKQRMGMLGVYQRASYVPLGPIDAAVESVRQTGAIVSAQITGLGQIITRQRSVKELGGPVKIAQYSGEALSHGWLSFVGFVAFISINLAFINLLPIPALDGGHLAFYAAEAVRRKPVGQRSQEWAFRTGVAFVLALMLFVTFNDIASLPIFGR